MKSLIKDSYFYIFYLTVFTNMYAGASQGLFNNETNHKLIFFQKIFYIILKMRSNDTKTNTE